MWKKQHSAAEQLVLVPVPAVALVLVPVSVPVLVPVPEQELEQLQELACVPFLRNGR